ncbi:MAG TPA: alpha/beta hydrolase [Ktedonobacterales bacterium]|nr:alpha/beta hydrolase [Ktedonobacterales bacterium]
MFEGLVQLPEIQLFVRQYGRSGPRVVIVHGGPDWDHTYFLPFVLPLAAHCRLTLFDLRGCGRSQKLGDPSAYHIDLAVADLTALIGALDLAPVNLLGFSYGGRVALRFTDRHPELVSRLVLASTTAYEDYAADLERWDEYQRREAAGINAEIERITDDNTCSNEEQTRRWAAASAPLNLYDLALLPRYREVLDRVRFSGEWMAALKAGKLAGVRHADYGSRLSELGLPVLVLHGEKDMCFPVSVAKRLHAAVTRSKLVVIPHAGHMAHIEATEAWNAAVQEFVCGQGGVTPRRRLAP